MDSLHRQLVATRVLSISRVPPHPSKLDPVSLAQVGKFAPQVGIDCMFPFVAHPAVDPPTLGPALPMPSTTYCESLCRVTRQLWFKASKPLIGPINSTRLVVAATRFSAMLAVNQGAYNHELTTGHKPQSGVPVW